MQKKMKTKLLVFAFIVILMIANVSACSKVKGINGNKAMGRYVEEEIKIPEKYYRYYTINMVKNLNDNIEVYMTDNKKYIKLTLNEDSQWEAKEQPWLAKIKTENLTYVKQVILGEDGFYYALIYDYIDGKDNTFYIYQCNTEDADPIKINVPYFVTPYEARPNFITTPIISSFGVFKDGNIIANDAFKNKLLYISKETGEILSELDTVEPFVIKGDELWATNPDDKAVTHYSSTEKKMQIDSNVIGGKLVVTDKAFYILNDKGIHRLEKDGSLLQTVVDGALTSISNPRNSFTSFYVSEKEKEEYYVLGNGVQSKWIYHYYFDETIPSVPEHEITVYSLYENGTIRQGINVFQKNNRDVKVNYIVAMEEENSATISDIIRALNTELITGEGADILVLDGLPINQLKEKGVLEDVSDIINPMIEYRTLISNIVEEFYENDRSIYAVPVRFQAPFFYGSEEVLDALSNMDKLVQYINKNPNKRVISPLTYEELATTFFQLNYDNLVNKDGEMDKEALISFLENLEVVSNNIGASDELYRASTEIYKGMIRFDNGFGFQEPEILEETTEAGILQLRSGINYIRPAYVIRERGLTYQSINNQFVPSILIGLNKASKNKELAKDFMKLLFTKEIQDSIFDDGFPVNENVFMKWMVEYTPARRQTYIQMASGIQIIDYPSSKEVIEILSLAKRLDTPIIHNKLLSDGITDNIVRYLEGSATAEQVAQDIQNFFNTYLSE